MDALWALMLEIPHAFVIGVAVSSGNWERSRRTLVLLFCLGCLFLLGALYCPEAMEGSADRLRSALLFLDSERWGRSGRVLNLHNASSQW
jgi:hypothetical protein